MSGTGEATVNPDGSTTFENAEETTFTADEGFEGAEIPPLGPKGYDPAIFLVLGFVAIVAIWYFLYSRKSKKENEDFSFFSELHGEKVCILLKSSSILTHTIYFKNQIWNHHDTVPKVIQI